MKIAIYSDELYPVNEYVIQYVQEHGHEAVRFGALKSGHDESWASAAYEAAKAIINGECNEGIFFCWSGTGVTIGANKVPGIRAALCIDAEMAKAGRIWNHANVITLSNRLLTADLAKEILGAWFSTPWDPKGKPIVDELVELEKKLYREPVGLDVSSQ